MENDKSSIKNDDLESSEEKCSGVETNHVKRELDELDHHNVKKLKTEQDNIIGEEEKTCGQNTECGSDFSVDGKEDNSSDGLSKKKRRKLEKIQKWLEGKKERRAREKERAKRNRMMARLNNISLGPSRNALKKSTMANSNCKVRVVIDLSFDDLMSDLDMGKCVKQMLHCYSLNRRAENPMQLYFTNFNGKVEKEMEKHEGYRNWDIYFHSDSYTEIFDKSELVYLTSESDNVITKLEDDKVYIIGGLVDHNAHKGVCYRVAVDQKIGHAQLPLKEFLDLKTRKVLTIDHVFEILLGVSSGMDWKEAFLKVLPARKGAKEREIGGDKDRLTVTDKNLDSVRENQTDAKTLGTDVEKDGEKLTDTNSDMLVPVK